MSDLRLDLRLDLVEVPDGAGDERRRREWDRLLADLASLSEELFDDIDRAEADPATASLCPGWSVTDVVAHFVAGDDLARRALGGENPFPRATDDDEALNDFAATFMGALGDMTLTEASARFREARRELLETARAIPSADQKQLVPWAAKPIGRFALVQSRLMETWVHGWDFRWPLRAPQVLDDRAWWVSDIAVRHLPYGLRKHRMAVASARVRVALDGPGGGEWVRDLPGDGNGDGGDPKKTAEIAGPAWAWITWATRRHPGRAARHALSTSGSKDAHTLLDVARCYA